MYDINKKYRGSRHKKFWFFVTVLMLLVFSVLSIIIVKIKPYFLRRK